MKFKVSSISLNRSITSYAKIQAIIAMVIRNRTFHIQKAVNSHKKYLNVGCGSNSHQNFVNLDYNWNPQIDICWDITKGIPLPNESVEGVYTEHCLEHLPFRTIDFVLNEFWRVLKPGGTVRIIVPDGELYLTRYTNLLNGKTTESLPYSESDGWHELYSPIMSINRIFRTHGHLFISDFDCFRQLLVKNGFSEIKQESFMNGRDSNLLIDSEHRAIESLYVEATKPH